MNGSRVEAEKLSDFAARLTCTIKRRPESVYDAWVQPEQLAKWFVPEPGATCTVQEFDATVGGQFRFTVDTGEPCTAYGAFKVLDRPNRIVLTWMWEESNFEKGETLVTLDFIAEAEGTRLILTHERMSNTTSRDNHMAGWSGCLASLATYEETKQP